MKKAFEQLTADADNLTSIALADHSAQNFEAAFAAHKAAFMAAPAEPFDWHSVSEMDLAVSYLSDERKEEFANWLANPCRGATK